MTDQEMINAVKKVVGLSGMTANERLVATGLMNEFDKARYTDKVKARRILELIQMDKGSIDLTLE